ncbi:MAG: rhomboid family intramembrane serine protease [Nitrospirae bacterium]|nr:rhomboid family intramembrane serine protease [Nitrospirota bacterium]MDA1305308.1 rhomboid family intramembrane serine protease [Nitrospirota bacterium]
MIPLKDDNPTETKPIVTIGFILACVLVFFHQVSLQGKLGEIFVYQYGAIPAVVFGYADLPVEIMAVSPYGSLMTSMFLHGGWMHLIGNMMYLWIFGNNIEDVMGHVKFIMFYALCGIFAALSHAAIDSESAIPMVGASGAISGVLGAYLLLYPHARVLVLIPFGFFTQMIYVPAGIVLGLWFLLQLVSGGMSAGNQGGGVAFFAHIGGFVAGMALIPLFKHSHVRFFNPANSRSHYRH